MVKVPPRRSSSVALPSRTRWASAASSRCSSTRGFLSTSRDDRDDQAALGRDRHAEVAVALDDQLARRRVETGVERRVLPERERGRLQEKARRASGRGRARAPPRRCGGRSRRARSRRHGRSASRGDDGGGERHALGDGAPQVRQGLSLHRPPLLEPRQRRLRTDRLERLRNGSVLRGRLRRRPGARAARRWPPAHRRRSRARPARSPSRSPDRPPALEPTAE